MTSVDDILRAMLVVQADGSWQDGSGRVVFFSIDRFRADVVSGRCCYLCGEPLATAERSNEHVLPNWLLRRHGLHGRTISLPNERTWRYDRYKVPCCARCNARLGRELEQPASDWFAGDAESMSRSLEQDPRPLFVWLANLFFKTHFHHNRVPLEQDARRGSATVGDTHVWEELHHIHCLARAARIGSTVSPEALGSLLILPARGGEEDGDYDFLDLTEERTLMVRSGKVAVIAVLNDSTACLQHLLANWFPRVDGPFPPLAQTQLREVAARLAYLNEQLVERPQYFSRWDHRARRPVIGARLPERQPTFRPFDAAGYGRLLDRTVGELFRDTPGPHDARIARACRRGEGTFLEANDGGLNDGDSFLEIG